MADRPKPPAAPLPTPGPLPTGPGAAAPDLRLPSLEALRAFDTAARLGTFERAAEALNLSASAVGKRIASLEELLGVALFQRGAKQLSLSAAGREYLLPVRAALDALAAVPLHRRTAQQRQRLRISAPPTFTRLILVPALPAYAQAHPEVELELVLSVPFLDQGSGDADLHVRHGTALAGPADLLMQDWLLPLASPALLGNAGLRQPADLARLPLLRTPVEPWAPWFDAAGLDWPEPEQGHRLIDLGLTLEAALCGQGVALARPSLARLALREGRLLPALGHGSTPLARAASGYYLLPHAGSSTPGQAADCARWLQQACRDAAAEGLALVSGGA